MPNNSNWLILSDEKKLIFSDYGAWDKTLINAKAGSTVVLVIFLQDLIKNLNKENAKGDKVLEKVFDLLKNRLKKRDTKIILSYSSWEPSNLINTIKNNSNRKQLLKKSIKIFEKLSNKFNNFYSFNLDERFSYHGLIKCFDKRNWYLARCRLSTFGLSLLIEDIKNIMFRIENPTKKLLVLDCDNTLWGGVLGEEGFNKIQLGEDGIGKAFYDFQIKIKELKQKGILLALCSKNNERDVLEVFKKNHFMVLKENDIIISKINWREKSTNLLEISKYLNISLNSIVFWDDNPLERDKVRNNLKEVEVIEPDKEIVNWPDQLTKLNLFEKFTVTSEDLKKTEQYKNRAKFIKEKDKTTNESKYLKSINLRPKLHKINFSTINRAVQLSQKTNQFNLRTIRYDQENLKKILKKSSNGCFLVSLKDIYGDHGIIGMVCAIPINKKIFFLDTFLMSCRIFGRNLELWMLNEIVKRMKIKKVKFLLAEYIPSKKNQIVANFLETNGFKKLSNYKTKEKMDIEFSKNLKKRTVFIGDLSKIKVKKMDIFI